MLTRPDYSFLQPSEKAVQNYRSLKQANIVVYALLGVLVVLGIWNVLTLASIIRADTAIDLADTGSISSHISSRLILWISLLTLGIYIFKEWKWGERTFAAVYFLAGLFFLAMVPVMSAEMEPAEENMVVRFTLNYCTPGAIEGGEMLDSSLCTLVDPADYTVFMASENPVSEDPEWLTPNAGDSFGHGWQVEARGKFRVYFLLEQPSAEQCDSALTTSVASPERHGHHCLERDGKTWLVQAYETSANEGGRLTVYQEVEP